jgi:hypothetical protein
MRASRGTAIEWLHHSAPDDLKSFPGVPLILNSRPGVAPAALPQHSEPNAMDGFLDCTGGARSPRPRTWSCGDRRGRGPGGQWPETARAGPRIVWTQRRAGRCRPAVRQCRAGHRPFLHDVFSAGGRPEPPVCHDPETSAVAAWPGPAEGASKFPSHVPVGFRFRSTSACRTSGTDDGNTSHEATSSTIEFDVKRSDTNFLLWRVGLSIGLPRRP